MHSSKAIEIIYAVISKELGHAQARAAVQTTIGLALYDLKEENLEIKEHNISKKLQKYAQDYQEASKSDVA